MKMDKISRCVLIIMVMLQGMLPTLAVAESQESPRETVHLVSAEIISEQNDTLRLKGTAFSQEESRETVTLNAQLEASSGDLLAMDGQVIGSYQAADSLLELVIRETPERQWQLDLRVILGDQESVELTHGENQLVAVCPPMEETETTQSTEYSSEVDFSEEVSDPLEPTLESESFLSSEPVELSDSLGTRATHSIKNYPGINLLNQIGSEKLPATYGFVPKMNGETVVSVTIADGSPYTVEGNLITVTPKNQDAIEGTIYYQNIGSYENRLMDVSVKFVAKKTSKIVIKDVGYYNLYNPKVAGIAEAKITTSFIDHETKLPQAVSGNFTIDNINKAKYLGLDLSQYSRIYAMNDSVVTYDDKVAGINWLFATRDDKGTPQVRLTFAYDQKKELSFSMKALFSNGNTAGQFGVGYATASSMVNQELAPALKTGMTGTEPNTKELLYTIDQEVPFQAVPLGSFRIEDQLNKVLNVDPKDVRVMKGTGELVTEGFDITVTEDNRLSVVAKAETVNAVGFANNRYSVSIYGQLDTDNLEYHEMMTNGVVHVPNQATTYVELDLPRDSNQAFAYLPVAKGEVHVRHVDEAQNDIQPKEVLSDYPGQPYKTTPLDLAGFELLEQPSHAEGIFTAKAQEVRYLYRDQSLSVPEVESQDKIVEIGLQQEFKGAFNWQDEASPWVSFFYELDEQAYDISTETENAPVGSLHQQPLTIPKEQLKPGINYVTIYGRNQGSVMSNKLVIEIHVLTTLKVVHRDLYGESIAPDQLVKGLVGQTYETQGEDLKGFELQEVPENAAGIFGSTDSEVVYTYKGKRHVKSTDTNFGRQSLILTGQQTSHSLENTVIEVTDFLKEEWQLHLSVASPMANDQGELFKGQLEFCTSETSILLDEEAKPIHKSSLDQSGIYELEWQASKGEGIKLTQYPGNQIGAYKSILAWQIVIGPE